MKGSALHDLMTSAYSHFEEGDLPSAEKICLKLIELDTSFHLPFHILGLIYFQQGNNKKAIAYLEKALEIAPQNKQLQKDLARIKKS